MNISTFTSVGPYVLPSRQVSSSHTFKFHLEVQRPSQTASERGEAKLWILNFKTIWSKFQKVSQISAEQGEAKLRELDYKTLWSEFQRASQTAA